MNREKRPRLCHRYRTVKSPGPPRGSKQICIPMDQSLYQDLWNDAVQLRAYLDQLIEQSPELFPSRIKDGYHLTGHLPESKKMPGIRLRQIQTCSGTYTNSRLKL